MSHTKTWFENLTFSSFVLGLTILVIFIFRFTYLTLDARVHLAHPAIVFFVPSFVKPEPFKVVTYLAVMLAMVPVVLLFRGKTTMLLKNISQNTLFRQLIPFLFLMLLLYFLWLIGTFPLFEWNQVTPWKTITSIGYAAAWLAFILFLPKLFSHTQRHQKIFESVVALGLIIFLTYMPTFPVSVFDYTYLIGPAAAVAHGQTLYTQAPSQYGFGSILIFGVIEKLFPGSFVYMAVEMWLLYVIEIFLLYIFFHSYTRSFRIGLFVVAALLTFSFFTIIDTPFGIPQAGAFRWLPPVVAFLLVFYGEKHEQKNKLQSYLYLIVVALWSLLVIDVGIAISLSLGAYWGLRFLARHLSFGEVLKKGLIYGFGLVIGYLFFTAVSFFLGGSVINLVSVFHAMAEYGSEGFSTLPLDFHSFFWLYFLTMIVGFIVYASSKKETTWHRAVLLSTLLFMTAAIYFVNRSHPHNLFNISSIWLLQLFVLITPLLKKVEQLPNKQKSLAYTLGVGFFILIPAFSRQANLSHTFREKIGRLPIAQSLPKRLRTNFSIDYERDLRSLPKTYQREIQLLQTTFPQQNQPIVIFALDDTYLHYFSQRPDLLWSDPLSMVIQPDDLTHALLPIKQNGCPTTIAYDPTCVQKDTCARSPNYGYYVAQGEVYKAFIKMCGSYTQSECAGTLCVAKRE